MKFISLMLLSVMSYSTFAQAAPSTNYTALHDAMMSSFAVLVAKGSFRPTEPSQAFAKAIADLELSTAQKICLERAYEREFKFGAASSRDFANLTAKYFDLIENAKLNQGLKAQAAALGKGIDSASGADLRSVGASVQGDLDAMAEIAAYQSKIKVSFFNLIGCLNGSW